jgi:hypothetical protein
VIAQAANQFIGGGRNAQLAAIEVACAARFASAQSGFESNH